MITAIELFVSSALVCINHSFIVVPYLFSVLHTHTHRHIHKKCQKKLKKKKDVLN